MKTIDITVNLDGTFHIDANGFSDNKCLDVLKDLEAIFGKAKDITMKNEARKHHVEQKQKA